LPKTKKPKLGLTDLLLNQLDTGGLSLVCEREYRFSPLGSTWRHFKSTEGKRRWTFEQTAKPRLWRFDIAFPAAKIAVEIQGGTFIAGAHSRGASQTGDNLKLIYAQLEGWTVLFADAPMIRAGVAADLIRQAIGKLNERPTDLDLCRNPKAGDRDCG
jgi:hypothetical protein